MEAKLLTRPAEEPDLFYAVRGSGAPVILIHGVGADASSWDVVADRLARRFRVVTLDLRGHGRSGHITGPIALSDFVNDVLAVMDALDLERANVAGFSLGGMIGQALALAYPSRVERLALISAVAARSPEEREKITGRLRVLRQAGIAGISAAAEQRWFTDAYRQANPEKVAARMRQLLENDPASYEHAYTVFCTADMGEELAGIRAETLIVTGEDDVGSNTRMAQFMGTVIPKSHVHILPGLRHSVLVEAPGIIADLLENFFLRQADVGRTRGAA